MAYESNLINKLTEFSELDVAGGIKLFAGKEKIYEKSVRMISDKFETYLADLNKAETLQEIEFITHTLKGVLGNIGANNLAKKFTEIMQWARTGDEESARSNFPVAVSEYISFSTHLADTIKQIDNAIVPEELSQGSELLFETFIVEMKNAVDNFEYAYAENAFSKIKGLTFGEQRDGIVSKLKTAIDGFDFIAAEEILNNI
jgi:HPt (histidine-containing phosphotransfer) domain-containing protein